MEVEELETRALLSALAPAPAGDAISTLTVLPNLTATPLAGGGGMVWYTPGQIRQAYAADQVASVNGVPITGAGQTIAIVDAFGDPNILNDANTFSQSAGLPAFNQPGGPSLSIAQPGGPVSTNIGWAGEISLDVEWAHAIAPRANILLVEAPSASYSDLLPAVQFAARQAGVVAVSLSWGSSEFYNEWAYDSTFTAPAGHLGGSSGIPGRPSLPGGVTFVASSGDNGAWHGPEWPAVSPNVLAVGGTSLRLSSANNYAGESGWNGSGGGYGSYESEPSYQRSAQGSGRRTSPDVAYNADPNTGFIVYDTVGLPAGYSGWWSFGGTSAGAPQWSAILALADQARALKGYGSLGNAQSLVYNLPSGDFHDITSGSNGFGAVNGYDLVTGRGSPLVNRIVADLMSAPTFASSSSVSGQSLNGPPIASSHPNDAAVGLSDPGSETASAGAVFLGSVRNSVLAGARVETGRDSTDAETIKNTISASLLLQGQRTSLAFVEEREALWGLASRGLSAARVERLSSDLARHCFAAGDGPRQAIARSETRVLDLLDSAELSADIDV